MEESEREGREKVSSLIDKATNSTDPEIETRLLKAIKLVVRSSDSELRLAVETLMEKMKKDHSQVRYLTLLIIDELFMRSKLFRSLLVVNFDQFLSLSIGFRRNLPLPAPLAVASRLRTKAIEYLEKWNTSFGIHYRQLRLGYGYLKDTLRFQFPNLQQHAARAQRDRNEREARSKEILLKKFETLRENFLSIKNEVQSTIDEIGECLEILKTEEDGFIPLDSVDDDDVEDFRPSALQKIRLESLNEGEKICEDSDNKVVFDALRELHKLLVNKHLVIVQEWMSVLVRVEATDTRFRDSSLKEFIDIRNRLRLVKTKCEQTGCSLTNPKDRDDDDMWEECKIDMVANGSCSAPNPPSENLVITSTLSKVKNITPVKIETSNGTTATEGFDGTTSVKSKLLAEAPIHNWGSYLDNWGNNRDFLANQRGLELENHWGRVDSDAVIPAERIAELNVQATLYKEEPVEVQPCLAPLKKGGLCQRKDLRVCPFHGPIIPRDPEGKAIDQGPTEEKTIDLEAGVTEQLAKRAVKNVREREREDLKQRENDKKNLKRAKLAKVREHNEKVLRQSAIASTSQSEVMGEDWASVGGNGSHGKEKKQTLASMLRKKVKPKDRITQKLLSARVRDATTRQLAMGADAKYREAYPNQW
ncbi:hypothetical protein GIB67_042240 [Kingdonia uniflora]|uniref:UV-stimulated scaffold protein A C-terminal domain-containing protein n=1 Tax=Kingdonia uniflora TaxID=39325 RepID=A0A7J7LDX1_9MAGN|nr:hypothetical protein GIB67_042240 [Kingdonia uniflora]